MITSKVTSLPEAAGPCAIYVDPDNPDSIAKGIENSSDEKLMGELIRQIPGHVEQFSLKNTTKEWTQLYSEMIGKK